MFPIIPANSLAVEASTNSEGIFAYGTTTGYDNLSMSNLVSNSGVVASDTTGVGTDRRHLAGTEYGGDKGIFGFGHIGGGGGASAVSNKVSNSGVVADDTAGVGTARAYLAACEYGDDKGIFGYGYSSVTAVTNKVSNVGVVASDTAGVGTARFGIDACSFN